jgi:tetratricopeptide (TPR) repeat protein
MNDVLLNLGKQMILLFEQGNIEEAMVIYRKVEKFSDQVKNKKMLAHFYYHFGSGIFSCLNRSMASGMYKLEQFQFLTDLLGQSLVYMRDAITSLIKATKIDKEFVEAFFLLGQALEYKGRWPEAEDAYRNALDIKPNWNEVQMRLQSLLTKMKNKSGQN